MGKKKQRNKGYSKGWKKKWIEGWQRGYAIGELNATRTILLDIISVRFPSLMEMAKRRVQKIQSPMDLRQLAKQIVVAPDVKTALHALMSDAIQELTPIPTINNSEVSSSS